MPVSRFLQCALLALAASVASGVAVAAPISAPTLPSGRAALLHPLELIKQADLNFGYVGAVGAGTVVIDPTTGTTTATGGTLLLGGTPHPAWFTGAAQSSSVVIIRVPKQPITVTRVGGTETMTVRDFTLEGLDKRAVAARVKFDFRVGATLVVPANQAEGLYTGTFDVTVQYP